MTSGPFWLCLSDALFSGGFADKKVYHQDLKNSLVLTGSYQSLGKA